MQWWIPSWRGCQPIYQIYSLATSSAFLCRSSKGHLFYMKRSLASNKSERERTKRIVVQLFFRSLTKLFLIDYISLRAYGRGKKQTENEQIVSCNKLRVREMIIMAIQQLFGRTLSNSNPKPAPYTQFILLISLKG